MMHRPFAKKGLLGWWTGIALLVPLSAVADEVVVTAPTVAASRAGAPAWSVRLPVDGKVNYRGVVGFDNAGTGNAGMLYPAPNAIGLLVAVLAHGAIVESAKNAQKEKMQADANHVLMPYQDILNTFDVRELMRLAWAKSAAGAGGRLIEQNEALGRDMVVQSVPVFSLTQDQKAIVLDSAVGIWMPGAAAASATYQSTVRVVSDAKELDDPLAHWTTNRGERLKDESARLLAESWGMAMQDIATDPKAQAAPYKTVRYREGSAEKMERAQVLSTRCDRLLIRTLRGLLMSVPTAQTSTESCATVASGATQ